MKYETPELTALTPAINAVQAGTPQRKPPFVYDDITPWSTSKSLRIKIGKASRSQALLTSRTGASVVLIILHSLISHVEEEDHEIRNARTEDIDACDQCCSEVREVKVSALVIETLTPVSTR